MKVSLRENLVRAEQQFLLAILAHDEEALENFSQQWTQLLNQVKTIEANNELDDETALYFFRVSKAIESVTECMLQSETLLQDAHSRLISDLGEFPPDSPPASLSPPSGSPRRLLYSYRDSLTNQGIIGQHGGLDTHAYLWLMQNIQNPYPTTQQVRELGDLSKISIAQVEHWFQEARDLIGWTKLSYDLFAGSRDATVSTANRVYLEHDYKDIPFGIVFAFTAVKAFAETLFSECPAPQESPFPGNLVPPTHCVTRYQDDRREHSDSAFVGSEDALSAPQADSLTPHGDFKIMDNDGYEEDTTPPPPVAGCKRYRTESELALQSLDSRQPRKRFRTSSATEDPHFKPGCTPASVTPAKQASALVTIETATPHLPRDSSSPSLSLPPESQCALSPLVSRKRSRDEMDGRTLREADSSHLHDNLRALPRRRISEADVLGTIRRPCSPSIMPPINLSGYLQSAPQFLVNSEPPANFHVFDWNYFSSPAEAVPLMPQPTPLYVPSSDLSGISSKHPDLQYVRQCVGPGYNPPCSFGKLGSLEDFNSLLQFPPAQLCPSDPLSSASLYSETRSLPSDSSDWSRIAEFFEQLPIDSAQPLSHCSPTTTPSSLPNTPEHPSISCSSLLEPHAFGKPGSLLDLSTPPSAFLPAQPGAFTEDNYMWSFLCG